MHTCVFACFLARLLAGYVACLVAFLLRLHARRMLYASGNIIRHRCASLCICMHPYEFLCARHTSICTICIQLHMRKAISDTCVVGQNRNSSLTNTAANQLRAELQCKSNATYQIVANYISGIHQMVKQVAFLHCPGVGKRHTSYLEKTQLPKLEIEKTYTKGSRLRLKQTSNTDIYNVHIVYSVYIVYIHTWYTTMYTLYVLYGLYTL